MSIIDKPKNLNKEMQENVIKERNALNKIKEKIKNQNMENEIEILENLVKQRETEIEYMKLEGIL